MKFKSKYGMFNVREIGESTVKDVSDRIQGAYAYQHTIKVTFNEKDAQFPFTGSINDYQAGERTISEEDLHYALEYWLSDGISGDMDFDDFCDEFGYEIWADDPDEASSEGYNNKSLRVHKTCQKARDQAERLGITLDMAYDISDEIREAGYE